MVAALHANLHVSAIKFSASTAAAYVLMDNGELWGWGANTYGEIDNSGVTAVAPPVFIVNNTFTDISAGGYMVCGLTASRGLRCWGRNNVGQLGDGTKVNKAGPTAATTDVLTDVISFDCGDFFACALKEVTGSNNEVGVRAFCL